MLYSTPRRNAPSAINGNPVCFLRRQTAYVIWKVVGALSLDPNDGFLVLDGVKTYQEIVETSVGGGDALPLRERKGRGVQRNFSFTPEMIIIELLEWKDGLGGNINNTNLPETMAAGTELPDVEGQHQEWPSSAITPEESLWPPVVHRQINLSLTSMDKVAFAGGLIDHHKGKAPHSLTAILEAAAMMNIIKVDVVRLGDRNFIVARYKHSFQTIISPHRHWRELITHEVVGQPLIIQQPTNNAYLTTCDKLMTLLEVVNTLIEKNATAKFIVECADIPSLVAWTTVVLVRSGDLAQSGIKVFCDYIANTGAAPEWEKRVLLLLSFDLRVICQAIPTHGDLCFSMDIAKASVYGVGVPATVLPPDEVPATNQWVLSARHCRSLAANEVLIRVAKMVKTSSTTVGFTWSYAYDLNGEYNYVTEDDRIQPLKGGDGGLVALAQGTPGVASKTFDIVISDRPVNDFHAFQCRLAGADVPFTFHNPSRSISATGPSQTTSSVLIWIESEQLICLLEALNVNAA
ncbi:uncharacterized protein BXZ73DRAFT_83111 [Epithele typhae]|uniref:uncharacterized protein n=1 Tax=Epithele typhae TaxID=378194 RepID=UPI002008529E|nr:uncharacterized protein BXZ73DRAFT_83111 [Epithele typhae]KAH9910846.1 hypothetical protein BXZ73DRAFT_83111 [Epithele typhae]